MKKSYYNVICKYCKFNNKKYSFLFIPLKTYDKYETGVKIRINDDYLGGDDMEYFYIGMLDCIFEYESDKFIREFIEDWERIENLSDSKKNKMEKRLDNMTIYSKTIF